MHECFTDGLTGHFGEVAARFAEANAAQTRLPDGELLANQMIEGNASGDNVAACFRRGDCEPVIALEGFESFDFNERHIATRTGFTGEGTGFFMIPVALKSATGYGTR